MLETSCLTAWWGENDGENEEFIQIGIHKSQIPYLPVDMNWLRTCFSYYQLEKQLLNWKSMVQPMSGKWCTILLIWPKIAGFKSVLGIDTRIFPSRYRTSPFPISRWPHAPKMDKTWVIFGQRCVQKPALKPRPSCTTCWSCPISLRMANLKWKTYGCVWTEDHLFSNYRSLKNKPWQTVTTLQEYLPPLWYPPLVDPQVGGCGGSNTSST